MRRTRLLVVSMAVAAGVLAGCNGAEVLGAARQDSAAAGAEIVVDGIRAMLVVTPAEVQRTHPFTARLTLTNTLATPATWTSGMGCIAFLNVYRDNVRIPLRGTDFACLAVVTARVLAPGESLTTSWDLVAQTTDGTPLKTGNYVFEADPILKNRLTLKHPLVIR
jgi:predicted small secreted protein